MASKEYYNHTYPLTDLNRGYLVSYVAVISGHDEATIEKYFRELETDEEFRSLARSAIQKFGRSAPADLSKLTQPTLIANGDNDRMVPSVLSEDLHRRIKGSELIIYPDSGHGGVFQYHEEFAPLAAEFLAS